MIFLGCDPGLSGAIALWQPSTQRLVIFDMPTLQVKPKSQKRSLNAIELARIIDAELKNETVAAVIEQAGSRPGEGTASAHANGRHWGIAYGILCANFIPTEIVAPVTWKRRMNCPSAKDGARARASQLLPKYAGEWALKKHDGRAEAALLALYAELLTKQREVGKC